MRPLDIETPGSALFPANEAKHDRIVLGIRVVVPISRSQVPAYVEIVRNQHGSLLDVFRPERLTNGVLKIATTKRWHFALKGYLRPDDNGITYSGTLDLVMNPTRFLTHQTTVVPTEIAVLPLDEALLKSVMRTRQLKALTFNQDDNILITPAACGSSATFLGGTTFGHRHQWWDQILAVYLEQVRQMIADALSPYGLTDIPASVDYGALKQAEVYWEASTDNAPMFMRPFVDAVKRRDPEAQAFWSPSSTGGDANEQWVNVRAQRTIGVTLYAKTLTRVRCEVRYDANISDVLTVQGGTVPPTPLGKLRALCADASDRATHFWDGTRSSFRPNDEHLDIVRFLSAINRVSPEENRAALVSLLAARGCLVATPEGGFAPAKIVLALHRAGVLDHSELRGRSRSYHLAARYQRLFDRLFG